ncbi:SIMPL domain-containing protein [Flaviaesturariibacter aridisoli]|nr:SIMPL domain-containing protein [Flaviaesturariibacter aridisoli]
MKNILLLSALLLGGIGASAQNVNPNPYPRTITVTGSAEEEVTPDEIYVNVDLKEYEKKGQGKIALDVIRRDFLASARAVGIPDSLVTIAAYDGNNGNPWWQRKKKKEELYASITYQVKLKSSKLMDDLVARLDDNATQNFYISRVDHSRLADYRKQLKIKATQAAKEKAQYLAQSIGEQVSVAVTINEPVEYGGPIIYNRAAMASNVVMKDAAGSPDDANQPDFKKIKLKYDVTVVFALK